MTQIDSLAPKIAANRLLVPFAKKLLASSKLMENHADVLSSVMSSSRLDSADRHCIIQAAINQFSKSHKKSRDTIGAWLKLCAEAREDDFKASVTPMIGTLEPDQVRELESLTQMNLKVRPGVVV